MNRKVLCFLLLVVFAFAADLHGQIPQSTSDDARREAQRRSDEERRYRMQKMREFDTTMKPLTQPRQSAPASPTIDKETRDRIETARRIDVADSSRYSEFLRSEKTGMFKLFPDYDCVTKNVVRTDGNCKDFVMASSSFSFRTRGYIHPYYHDLGFNHGEIFNDAFFSQGIIVSLGDVPVQDVTPSHAGLKFIYDFRTASDPAEAKKTAAKLRTGVESGGFTYSSHFKPAENTTFGLRSVAYDLANSLPAVSESTPRDELRFHTLSLDKRGDVIIVFRIVRKGSDGSLTIAWKELDRKEAPKIKFPKGAKFVDFKPESEVAVIKE